ncbi:hypothetical protein [Allobaculum sp. Allo2]|uniref:hypothetical protein n=1 Tax=Allobaculum sp. Allo2 TaxID=2853432 RepID=UPI003462228F
MGEKAVDLLMQGIGGQCVAIRNNKITSFPIEKALVMPSESKNRSPTCSNVSDREIIRAIARGMV